MFQLLNSLRLWASNDGTGRSLTEGQLKREAQILKERLSKLDAALERAATTIITGITTELGEKVFDACPAATAAARSAADDTVLKWSSPVDRENWASGGLYWATYKAVVRRDGVFTNARGTINFNAQLIEPVIRHLATPWESVFARRMPGILNSLPTNAGQILTTFHDEVERRAIRNGASIASLQRLKHQIPVYKETIKDAMTEARNLITEKQRNINREFEPRVLEHMLSIYNTCTAETGPGQYSRMKGYMNRYVEQEKLTMFDDAVEHVRELAKEMLKEVKDCLLGRVDAVFIAIGRDYTSVVVGKEQGKSKEALPRGQRMARKAVLSLIDSAETTFKRVVGLDAEMSSKPEAGSQAKSVAGDEVDTTTPLEAHSEVKSEPAHEPVAVEQESQAIANYC